MREIYCYHVHHGINNAASYCHSVVCRTVRPSSFYGIKSRAQDVSASGPSHEESSDDLSAADDESTSSEVNS